MNAKGEGLNIVSPFQNADHPASGAFRCLKAWNLSGSFVEGFVGQVPKNR
jgi:hypothetical protein